VLKLLEGIKSIPGDALSRLGGEIAALDVEDGDGLVTAPQAGYEPKSNPESA
jgi:hypothetical protein